MLAWLEVIDDLLACLRSILFYFSVLILISVDNNLSLAVHETIPQGGFAFLLLAWLEVIGNLLACLRPTLFYCTILNLIGVDSNLYCS